LFSRGRVLDVSIEEEMQKSYIDYAMSVIVARALPDVRDGLKPVHRRILWAMQEMGMTHDKPYKKAARVVGEVLGKYHPHGDLSVYDAVVRMVQAFSSRYPLLDGHGNFGSVDGDSPAAMRYTEVRMSRLASEMLRDIDKDTIDFGPNFDDSLQEPLVLPSRIPNLLCNGSSGIAVGMATNIPPHNISEVLDAVIALIDNPEISTEELMGLVKGPDFPTGGLVLGSEGIREAYETGRGIITMRAQVRIEESENGKHQIVVTELPYQVNKARLLERIAELARERRIEGIADLRDESDRSGLRVVIELKRDANANVILNQLLKHTQLQQTFGIIMLALVSGRPAVLRLRDLLWHYLQHQKDIVTRRSRFELAKTEARAHILEGLRIALDNLDAVISLIRASHTVDEARQGLMSSFALSEKQAQAILEMRLQRLTGLERSKIEEEYQEILKTIEYLRAVLSSETMVYRIVKKELSEIKDRYGDDRRTIIAPEEGAFAVEDLIAEEDTVIAITHGGYIKRAPVTAYRSQHRGGRGVTAIQTKEEDFVEHLFVTTTHHYILIFTSRGRVFRLKVHEIPEMGRQARGMAMVNLVQVDPGESVTAVIPVKDFEGKGYLFMSTRKGFAKKTPVQEFVHLRRAGLAALTLSEGDELIAVRATDGSSEMVLATASGMCLRFSEGDVRPMGRTARGVRGIRLKAGDEVVGMERVVEGRDVLVVASDGLGKCTALSEYRPRSRGTRGIKTIELSRPTGRARMVGFRVVSDTDEVMLISNQGIAIRLPVSDIRKTGRVARGVTLIRLGEGQVVVALATVAGQNGGN
jgi:DNA gyrase subunit A